LYIGGVTMKSKFKEECEAIDEAIKTGTIVPYS